MMHIFPHIDIEKAIKFCQSWMGSCDRCILNLVSPCWKLAHRNADPMTKVRIEQELFKEKEAIPRNRNKQYIPSRLRWRVWERDNFTCRICGRRNHLTIDHILAESKGGTLDLQNLQTLCRPCNTKKGVKVG